MWTNYCNIKISQDFSPINDGYVEPSSTSNTQIGKPKKSANLLRNYNFNICVEPQCAPKKVRRSSSTANVFCPFCPKIYCRRDKMIEHIKKNHLGKCWFCFCDMGLVEHDGFVCPLCRQQFCCLKLSKYHKCTVCMHCKLKVPAFERKLHASKRSCSSCEKIFLCATASNNHNCPRAGPSQWGNVHSNGS